MTAMTAALHDRHIRLVAPAPATRPYPEVRSLREPAEAEAERRCAAARAAHPAGSALRTPAVRLVHPSLQPDLAAVVPPVPTASPDERGRRIRTVVAFVASWSCALSALATAGPLRHVFEAFAVGLVLVTAFDRLRSRTSSGCAGVLGAPVSSCLPASVVPMRSVEVISAGALAPGRVI